MEYRVNFLVQVFGMILNNTVFIVFWRVLIDRAGNISGYAFEDIMFLWALGSSAFGLGHILFGNARNLGRLILDGQLDVYLLQPKDALFSVLASRTAVSAFGDFIYGIAVIAIISGFDPARWAMFLLFTVSGSLLFVSSFVIMESLTFFAGNVQGLANAFLNLILSSTLYPDKIFAPGIRWIFYSLLPAAYIVFIPLKAFRELNPGAALISSGAAAAYCLAAYAFFRLGLKRYESGNLIGTRT
jgi:ABC-2 type transport system permease protein